MNTIYGLDITCQNGMFVWSWYRMDKLEDIINNTRVTIRSSEVVYLSILECYQDAALWAMMSKDCPMELTAYVIQLRH